MRKLFLLFVALLATTTLWAYDFQSGDLYYNITSDTTVEVTYQYEWSSNNYAGLTTATIPETVTYNGTTYSVTSIGNSAFYNCSSLTSITIPDSVTSIGDDTFRYCSSLTSITIPNSVTSIGDWAFHVCSSLTSITIPNGVTSIGDVAFMACSSLTSITIPNSVTSIGRGIFRGCRFTKENFVNNSTLDAEANNYWGAEFVDAEIDGLLIRNDTVIDCRMFVTSLTSITIPNSVTYIGERAFDNCSSLTSITIPNSVTYIGERAFDNCSSLNEVILGTGLETVKEYAFAGCSKLQDVYCYAIEPPTAYDSSFSQYNAFLYIPCENKKVYMLDEVFGNFKYIECISSDEVKTNDVVITPTTNDVTITWPAEAGADTYTIVIKKGNEVFCTLTFNADGQLLNIAFAPGRNGNHPVQYAEQAGNGYRFTVTGLEEGTHYAYNIDVKDAADKTIKSYTGEFTTESMTAVENITTNNANIQKILRDGQLLILRDGKTYTITGQKL